MESPANKKRKGSSQNMIILSNLFKISNSKSHYFLIISVALKTLSPLPAFTPLASNSSDTVQTSYHFFLRIGNTFSTAATVGL